MALVARRDDFPFHGDPAARPSAMVRLAGGLAFAAVYGVIADWAWRITAGLPVSFSAALLDTLRAMGGWPPRDTALLPAEFATWFPLSVASIAAMAVISAAAAWLRPWQHRPFPDPRRHQQAAQIVRRWGADTLAPFALRPDKEWHITGQTLIAYRVIRGVALISGDPIGPPDQTVAALTAFLARAQARGWRTAILGASAPWLPAYRELGLRPVYHGDEAVIDAQTFSLDGRRYVILQAWADLPRVVLAAMAAEGYLPHARLIRGPGWSPAAAPAFPAADGGAPPGPARRGTGPRDTRVRPGARPPARHRPARPAADHPARRHRGTDRPRAQSLPAQRSRP